MPLPSESEVRDILGDFHEKLRRVVDGAWSEWQEFPGKGKLVFPARARAVLVFDYIARRAQEEFNGDANIHVIVKKQTIQFLFKQQVLLRFKKGNARGVGSNILTQTVLDFIDPQRVIPGLVPEIMKVEVCYSIDDMGIGLDEVAVVARNEKKRIWAYPLDETASGAGAEIVPMPGLRGGDGSDAPVVTPKSPDQKTGNDEK